MVNKSMMVFKIALLDDNKEQLQINKKYLEQLEGTTVVAACYESKSFLDEVKIAKPDILVLDLNLGDSYMNGMEVAYHLKLPVIFVSSNTAQYIKEMEGLKRDFSICVDHLTKPFSENDFKKTINRFFREVDFFASHEHVYLDLGRQKRNKVSVDSIVYLTADKANGAESNNKEIYFNNRNKELLIDFSFSRMEDRGLLKTRFITIHKSYRVNVNHIKHYIKKDEIVEVEVFNASGKLEVKQLPVSENYQTLLKSFRK
jgi:DNA-binding LytR/AlgR family response regulator